MQSKPIAIIGMGAIFPKAPNLKDFWRLILNGRDAVTDVPETHWNPDEYFNADRELADHLYCKRGGFLEPYDFDPAEFGIPPANLDATDTSQLLGLVAANMALENAGYGKNAEFTRDRASVILGVTGTQELTIPLSSRLSHPRWRKAMQLAGIEDETAADVMSILSDSYVKWQENSFPGLLGNVVAGRISNRLDLRGTNCVVDAACASSLGALHLALLELEAHRSDIVVTGGVDTLNDVFMHMCFCKTGVLSATGDIRPFADNADGTVLGEGIGMLVLKRLEDAERDHDNIYAVIKSIGSSSDGKSQSIYAPTVKGQEHALRNAYAMADIAPATVELIEGHGTGTLVGDKVEISALQAVFGEARPHQTSVGSVKALVGHTKAAAGSAGIIKAALALYNKVLPPSVKIDTPNQILDDPASPFYLNVLPRPWLGGKEHPRRAGVSAFGFGGSNFHAVLEEYRPQKHHVSWDNTTQILAFSADDLAGLQTQIRQFQDLQITALNTELAHAAMQTRKNFSSAHELRLLVIISEDTNIAQSLAKALEIAQQAMPQNADNIFFGHGAPEGALAFLFPGQGSQYPHMGHNYATRFPQALTALELFDQNRTDLSNYIYPTAAFGEDARKRHFAELTQTDVAQPALGAVSLGMLEALRFFNVQPDFVMGHSFGELSALHAAGWLNYKDFARISAMRGAAVQHACTQGPAGAMLAVHAGAEELAPIINESGLDVCVANLNAKNQTVLAGSLDDIQKIAELLHKKNLKCTQLKVSGAFHSKFVTQACDYFAENTKDCALAPTGVKVVSNITGEFYPADAEAARDLLCRQIASPVNYMGGLETLYTQGVHTFVEVGPKTVLSALTKSILDGRDAAVLNLDKSRGRHELQDLAETLCALAAEGRAVALAQWEEDVPKPRANVMHVPLCGANFGPKEATWDDNRPRPKAMAVPKQSQVAASAPVNSKITAIPAPAPPQKAAQPAMAKPQSPVNYQQTTSRQNITMNNNNNLDIFEKSLEAIRQLQEQVTRAHEKFLDTQTEANRTLQSMLQTMTGGQPLPLTPRVNAPMSAPVATMAVPTMPVASPTPVVAAPTPAVAAPVPAAVVAPAQTAPTASAANNDIMPGLLAVVSELTGYPMEMLQPEMQLESDLGIDSIKRVEILSTLEERVPNLPHTDPEAMAALKTLGEIAAVLGAVAPAPAAKPAAVAQTAVPATPAAPNYIMPGLLAVVSELTGYPVEMLQPEMQLESDLGIDSIKRVEILSTLEERLPDLPHTDPEEMAALKTLGEIAAILGAEATKTAATPASVAQTAAPAAQAATGDVASALMAVVSELTGYPVEMLQPAMLLESDLGIDSIKRVEILSTLEERLPNLPQTDPEEMAALKTIGEITAALTAQTPQAAPATAAPVPAETPAVPEATVMSTGEIPQRRLIKPVALPHLPTGRIKLAAGKTVLLAGTPSPLTEALSSKIEALGAKARVIAKNTATAENFTDIQGLIIFSESAPDDHGADLFQNFTTVQHVGPALLTAEAPFVIGISCLDGAFGFGQTQAVNAAAAGLAGILKTLRIEWPKVNCRAVDLAPAWTDVTAMADAILAEIDQTDGMETGLSANGRVKLDLELTALPELDSTAFGKDDVFVITGGARGVTARAAVALSRAFQPKLALLGRSPRPFKEPAWLASLTEQGDIKKAIIANDFKDMTSTPKEVEAKYKTYLANREINDNLAQMCALGANAKYYSVDILDEAALRTAFTDIKADMGRVTALVHGAGVLEDKLVLDKSLEQFQKVYTTKVNGLNNLLKVTYNETLRAVALFSSVTARMGNKGQCDYAAANEILNKTAQNLALAHPEMKVTAFNWGPWNGGMVSAALKKEFAELKVDLIDMEGGAAAFVRELSAAKGPVEVVFGSGFDALLPKTALQPNVEKKAANTEAAPFRHLFDLTVNPQTYPILTAHVIGGNYVVPFVLSLEWLAHAALYENPGLSLKSIHNARIFKGLVIPAGAEAEVSVFGATPTPCGNGDFTAKVEVRAQINGKSFTHAGAQIIMGSALETASQAAPQARSASYDLTAGQVYEQVLFHGALLQGLQNITVCDAEGAEALSACLSKPRDFVAMPLRNAFLTEPLVIDCAFQLASLWCYENHKMVSLPGDFGALQLYGKFQPEMDIRIVLNVTSVKGNIMQGDFYFCDGQGALVASIQGFRSVMNPSLNQAFKPHLKVAV